MKRPRGNSLPDSREEQQHKSQDIQGGDDIREVLGTLWWDLVVHGKGFACYFKGSGKLSKFLNRKMIQHELFFKALLGRLIENRFSRSRGLAERSGRKLLQKSMQETMSPASDLNRDIIK